MMDASRLSIIANVIALASLGFSLWVYFKHDKKKKILEEEDLRREKQKALSADFTLSAPDCKSWKKVCVNVINIGGCDATDVKIETLINSVRFRNSECLIRVPCIAIKQPYGLELYRENLTAKAVPIKITWNDACGKGKSKQLNIPMSIN